MEGGEKGGGGWVVTIIMFDYASLIGYHLGLTT